MMIKKRYLAVLLLILIVAVFGFVSINQSVHQQEPATNETQNVTHEFIGNDSTGSVEVIRNLGNPNGERIAYVVGVHPLENDTHQTFLNQISAMDNLKHCYDVYIINVDLNFSQYGELYPDDEPGRAEGQDLAYKFVYPAIVNGSYKLAVDVHAHGGAYPQDTFVFCPIDATTGEIYGRNVSASCQNVSYYNPYQTTSGPYLTIPLNQNGVPAFYYEENSFISQDIKDLHMIELIKAVDNLKL